MRSQRGERQAKDIGSFVPRGEVRGLGRLGIGGRRVWMGAELSLLALSLYRLNVVWMGQELGALLTYFLHYTNATEGPPSSVTGRSYRESEQECRGKVGDIRKDGCSKSDSGRGDGNHLSEMYIVYIELIVRVYFP